MAGIVKSNGPEVVLITGCGSGIGKALARNFHERKTESGSKAFLVFATDYRADAMDDLKEEGITTARMDVTNAKDIQEVVAGILAAHSRIDICVCNAGLSGSGFLAEIDYPMVERVFNVNVHGTFKTVQAVVPHMLAARSGKIATLCSVNSYLAQPFGAPYCGSKAAVERMTESLSMEVAEFGVSVTSVVPGFVKSDIQVNALTDFTRFETPTSFYNSVVQKVKDWRTNNLNRGMTSAEAAVDIVNGLSKDKPPRFLYTGTEYLHMWRGLLQFWGGNDISASTSLRQSGLDVLYKVNADRKKASIATGQNGAVNGTANGTANGIVNDLEGNKEIPLSLRKDQ